MGGLAFAVHWLYLGYLFWAYAYTPVAAVVPRTVV